MAAQARRGKDGQKARFGGGQGKPLKRKSCYLCRDKVAEVDYKNVGLLRRYVSERGKIRSPRMTGACRRHQRQVAVAIKRAREMALLPYVADPGPPQRSSRSGDRSDRPDRDSS
jgi:small subunit ribosomal protein S18